MKPFLFFMPIFISIIFILALVTSCTSPAYFSSSRPSPTDPFSLNACCEECLAQAARDPSGYDISIKPCEQYGLSEECRRFFAKDNILVGECRKLD